MAVIFLLALKLLRTQGRTVAALGGSVSCNQSLAMSSSDKHFPLSHFVSKWKCWLVFVCYHLLCTQCMVICKHSMFRSCGKRTDVVVLSANPTDNVYFHSCCCYTWQRKISMHFRCDHMCLCVHDQWACSSCKEYASDGVDCHLSLGSGHATDEQCDLAHMFSVSSLSTCAHAYTFIS